ncbi:MAG: 2-C-methyl-D-erythritol 4-phosphate cytidylyltransferase [Candidatus Omnitrophica bacterium]|nr:2-C-methyl-D-erythritol 4-phosphate cytidylyltransferase [Candidatus Omnitrophota bacterium]
MVSAILLAAGKGKRLKLLISKPLVKIGKQPAITYSLKQLDRHPDIDEIILVVNSGNQAAIARSIKPYCFKKIKCLVLGGSRRQDSVYNGLKVIDRNSKWVLIHDYARPFIGRDAITEVIKQAKKHKAAIVAVRPKATIKLGHGNMVRQTLDRDKLWEIQTPQVFSKQLLLKAYNKYIQENFTDDAGLIEKLGKPVKIVLGHYANMKITTAEDLLLAQLIVKKETYEK